MLRGLRERNIKNPQGFQMFLIAAGIWSYHCILEVSRTAFKTSLSILESLHSGTAELQKMKGDMIRSIWVRPFELLRTVISALCLSTEGISPVPSAYDVILAYK